MENRFKNFVAWVDERFPLTSLITSQLTKYYVPKNFNFLYFFGSLALVVLVNQLLTGLFLTMHYKPAADLAFDSVEYIMRDVDWGWLIRYMHSTGSSAFFIVIYIHMFRALMYGSYKQPRELLWLFGMLIFVALMAEAFMGYLLPWGQMSYWGAQVIISLFGAIPVIGDDLALWIRGDYVVSDATLNRFFAFHVIGIPLMLVGLVALHLVALRTVGSNNPDGIEIKKHKDENGIPLDGLPFHPYFTVKDLVIVVWFGIAFAIIVFYLPEFGGLFLEAPNFIPADGLRTPEHIAPVWYFTPFYSILRAIPDKLGGVVALALSVLALFALPWLDRCPVKSIRYRGFLYKGALIAFAVSFVILGYLGGLPVTPAGTTAARICTIVYFAFFLAMPLYPSFEIPKPVPDRLTDHPSVPLSKKEGVFWCGVRLVLKAVKNSPPYQWLSDLIGPLLSKISALLSKI